MDDPASRPELFHPGLRDKTRTYVVLRSSMFSRWWYPFEDQISWFGDVRLYATQPQYDEWIKEHPPEESDIKIGPS